MPGVFLNLSGASVEQSRFWTLEQRPGGRLHESRVTDDLGRFRFVDIAPGDYEMTATPGRQAPQTQRVRVTASDVVGLSFAFRSGRTLTVHVRAPDGSRAESSTVEIRLPDGSRHRESGTNELRFTAPDADVLVRVVGTRSGQQAPEAQVVPKGTDEVTITLVAADDWTLEGVLLDADGAPVPRALLQAFSDVPKSQRSSASTAADGRFTLRLRGGTRATIEMTGLEVVATADGRGTTSEDDFEADAVQVARGAKDVVIRGRRVAGGQTLRVVVNDPEGRPLASIPMNLQRPNGGRFVGEGTTGADGLVEFRDLVGKRVEVHRGSGAYTMGETWTDPFVDVVPAGQTVEYRFAAGTIVRGVVLGPDGAAVAGAAISATCRDRWVARASVMTQADGGFAFPLDARTQLPLVVTADRGSDDGPRWSGRLVVDEMPAGPLTIRVAPPPITEK
jgi:hypothetical protein